MISPGHRLEGRYELLEPLGHDELATRWRARDLRSGRHVEVRIVDPAIAADEAAREMFLERIRGAKGVTHANLAKTLGGGTDAGTLHSVGQLVDGPTLREAIDAHGRLAPDEAVEIGTSVARALNAIHRRGLVHGRLTADEVRLGPDGRARLGGLAVGAFGSQDHAPTTPGDDVRALGIVLYQMLTSRTPVDANASSSTDDGDRRPAAADLRPGVPPSLSAIVERAMEADPARRYPSADALATALGRWRKAHPAPHGQATPALTPARAAAGVREQPGSTDRVRARDATPEHAAVLGTPGSAVPIATATARPDSGRLGWSAGGEPLRGAPGVPPGASPGEGPLTRRALARQREERRRERDVIAPTGRRVRGETPVILGAWVLVVLAAAALLGVIVAGQLVAGGSRPAASAPALGGLPNASRGPTASPTEPAATERPPATPPPSEAPGATAGTESPPPAAGPIRAPASLSAPARSVWAFYDAVANHDWPTAISLWSTRMQTDYPPQEYLIDRFTPTTRIKITDIRTRAVDSRAGTARVSISLIEYRTVEPSPRTFSGSWDLVLVDGRWLLDHPNF